MSRKDCGSKESHEVWKHFQHKFTLLNELGKFHRFFRKLLNRIFTKCAEQNLYVIELRHISGMVYDDNKRRLDIEEELQLIKEELEIV